MHWASPAGPPRQSSRHLADYCLRWRARDTQWTSTTVWQQHWSSTEIWESFAMTLCQLCDLPCTLMSAKPQTYTTN
jgi:hypothetical protein